MTDAVFAADGSSSADATGAANSAATGVSLGRADTGAVEDIVDQGVGIVTGLPGVAYQRGGIYYDNTDAQVTPTADVEFVDIKSARTGSIQSVSLATLKALLA